MLFKKPSLKDETSPPTYEQSLSRPYFSAFVLTRDSSKAKSCIHMAKKAKRDIVYFNPTQKNCPHFNPLTGEESDAVECVATAYRCVTSDISLVSLEQNDLLIRRAVKLLKRLDKSESVDGRYSTFYHLNRLIQNKDGEGRRFVQDLSKVNAETSAEAKENTEIVNWFTNEYFSEESSLYENTASVRSIISKITANEYLCEILNPEYDMGERNEIDFDWLVDSRNIVCLCVDGLRFLDTFLASMFFSRYQAASSRTLSTSEGSGAHRLYMDDYLQYFLLSRAPVSPL